MNQKKSTTLYGALMSPLAVGHCALIRYQGQLMRTSQVVAIHSWNADMICFETLNTNYNAAVGAGPADCGRQSSADKHGCLRKGARAP